METVIPDKEGFRSGFYLERFVREAGEVGELLDRLRAQGLIWILQKGRFGRWRVGSEVERTEPCALFGFGGAAALLSNQPAWDCGLHLGGFVVGGVMPSSAVCAEQLSSPLNMKTAKNREGLRYLTEATKPDLVKSPTSKLCRFVWLARLVPPAA